MPVAQHPEAQAQRLAPVGGEQLRERLVAALPEKQRSVVTLFYLQDKSVDEVGRALGMPEGTVKTLLHRARARLAEMLQAPSPAAAGG